MGHWSNETMPPPGARDGSMRAGGREALDAATTALVLVAAAVPKGSVPQLEARLRAARDADVPALWIEELLLQSMLVVGYPLALVAFAVWRSVNGSPPAPDQRAAEELAHADWESW